MSESAEIDAPSEEEREALDRASRVFGWQHLARYSGKSAEWLDLTLLAMVRAALAAKRVTHGKAWEDRLNIICLCGKVCSGVVRKNPAGGFIGHPGSDTYVDPPAAQVFANHLWEMNHPPVTSPNQVDQ